MFMKCWSDFQRFDSAVPKHTYHSRFGPNPPTGELGPPFRLLSGSLRRIIDKSETSVHLLGRNINTTKTVLDTMKSRGPIVKEIGGRSLLVRLGTAETTLNKSASGISPKSRVFTGSGCPSPPAATSNGIWTFPGTPRFHGCLVLHLPRCYADFGPFRGDVHEVGQ